MPNDKSQSSKSAQLRQRAEAMLRQSRNVEALSNTDMLELIHELEVHQMELEIQNEELQRAQEEISTLHQEFEKLYEFAPCGYVTLNPQGIITRCNLGGVQLLGATKTRLQGVGFSSFVAPEKRDDFRAALKQAAKSGSKETVQLQLTGADHEPLWILADIEAERNQNQEVMQWRLALIDITARQRAEEALRETETQYRTIVETALEGVWVLDSQGRTSYVNQRMAEMLGYTPEDMLGRPLFDFMDEEARQLAEIKWQERRQGYADIHEFRFQRQDGADLWALVAARPLTTEDGEPRGGFAMITDITNLKRTEKELKDSLQEKEVLLREVHHRVKNNLQVVSSLLDLTGMQTTNQEAKNLLAETRQRIYSMALIHLQIYQTAQFHQINMAAHINLLLVSIAHTFHQVGKRITINLEPTEVCLKLDQALPCTLVLNELLANAYKHAFPHQDHGTIRISLACADNTVTLKVADDGCGLPPGFDWRQFPSMGLKLAYNLVVHQLKGEIDLVSGPGLTAKVSFPFMP